MKKILLLFLLLNCSEQLFSQSFYNKRIDRKLVASFGSGTANYFGDLANPGKVFQGTRWNVEAGLEYRLDTRFSARASLTVFQLTGGDQFADVNGRKVRNLSFTTTALEFGTTGIVQLFEDGARYYQRKPINAFLLAGLAVTWYVPKGLSTNLYHDGSQNPSAGKMVPLRKLQTEQVSYSPVTLAIPIGGGIKLMATPLLNITISGAYRITFTDYLDDVSTVFPGIASFEDPLAAAMSDKRFELQDGVVAAPGAQRGNPDKKDGYFILSIRADYFLPPTLFRKTNKGSRYKRPKRR